MNSRTTTTAEEITLQTTYLEITARAWGPVDGLPVLALHGWLDNAASFDHLAPLLKHCRLIAIDLPGHGYSQWRPKGSRYYFFDNARDILHVMDVLQWQHCVLLGHSLGGGIASCLAAIMPERFSALIMLDALGPVSNDPQKTVQQLRKSLSQHSRRRLLPRYDTIEQAVDARRRANTLSRESAMTLAGRGLRTLPDGRLTWRTDPALTLTSPTYLHESQVLDLLTAIRIPTLFIEAGNGILSIAPEFTANRCRQIQNLHHHRLPGDHHFHLDNPTPIATIINRFLNDRNHD